MPFSTELSTPFPHGERRIPAAKKYVAAKETLNHMIATFLPVFKEKNWSVIQVSDTAAAFANGKGSSVSMRLEKSQVRVEVSTWNPKTFTAASHVQQSNSPQLLESWLVPYTNKLARLKSTPVFKTADERRRRIPFNN